MNRTTKTGEPLKVAIVGAGNRSMLYASYALRYPERMKIVAVAEPDSARRREAASLHQIPAEYQFESYAALAAAEKMADAVINGTMDRLHYDSSRLLLSAGYDLLLEKPIGTTEREVRDLIEFSTECERTVMICHVLRYAPFYQRIKEMVESDIIGEIISLHSSENVSYHHMATAFVRGRWSREELSNPMLLAKCCHDLDLVAWLMSGQVVTKVASFGSLKQFRREKAPAGSAARCLTGCQIESSCAYSARSLYITQNLWGGYVWECLGKNLELTLEQKLDSLKTDNPYGRCVWACDNDVVDHQTVIVEFANGATASHNMLCATARPTRTIHVVGERGEIEGDLEAGWIKLRVPSSEQREAFREELITIPIEASGISGHGGGDMRLVADFEQVLRGESHSLGATRIEDSLTGHLITFMAEQSRLENRVVLLKQ